MFKKIVPWTALLAAGFYLASRDLALSLGTAAAVAAITCAFHRWLGREPQPRREIPQEKPGEVWVPIQREGEEDFDWDAHWARVGDAANSRIDGAFGWWTADEDRKRLEDLSNFDSLDCRSTLNWID